MNITKEQTLEIMACNPYVLEAIYTVLDDGMTLDEFVDQFNDQFNTLLTLYCNMN